MAQDAVVLHQIAGYHRPTIPVMRVSSQAVPTDLPTGWINKATASTWSSRSQSPQRTAALHKLGDRPLQDALNDEILPRSRGEIRGASWIPYSCLTVIQNMTWKSLADADAHGLEHLPYGLKLDRSSSWPRLDAVQAVGAHFRLPVPTVIFVI